MVIIVELQEIYSPFFHLQPIALIRNYFDTKYRNMISNGSFIGNNLKHKVN